MGENTTILRRAITVHNVSIPRERRTVEGLMARRMPVAATTGSLKGLADWMRRVLEVCDDVSPGFEPGPVHELRVALRRCRTMADALEKIDPDPDWRRMRKIGGRLFRALGDLRDAQVMLEWTERLGPAGDPLRLRLVGLLGEREAALKLAASGAVVEFARRRWERLAHRLPGRVRRLPADGGVFESLALERWTQAFELHRAALRRRSGIGWHELRMGLKRFRYVVENFLPRRHESWGGDLKHLQDLLGEVHDLDVIGLELRRLRPAPEARAMAAWRERIAALRMERLAGYRLLTSGPDSLWTVWRAELPRGARVLSTSRQRLSVRASLLDPAFRNTRRVARLALDLHDGLVAAGIEPAPPGLDARRMLDAAAILHGTGRSRLAQGYQKASRALIRRLQPPPGWSPAEMEMVGLVVRYHRGAEPNATRADFAVLDPARRRLVAGLAGVLRVASALVENCDPPPTVIDAEPLGDLVQLWVTAAIESPQAAGRICAAAHCLGSALGRPVLVRSRFPRG